MGIKERERRVEVFFYGLFMDEELLRGKGLEPEGGEIAAIDGFALRIGQRAALVSVRQVSNAATARQPRFPSKRRPYSVDETGGVPLSMKV
jgi:hypothetical protein